MTASTEPAEQISRASIDPYDPELRRKNIRLGLVVTGAFLFFLITALLKFTMHGLPVDRTEHMKVKQRETAEAGAPALPEGNDR